MKSHKTLTSLVVLALLLSAVTALSVSAAPQTSTSQSTRRISQRGTTTFPAGSGGSTVGRDGVQTPEFGPDADSGEADASARANAQRRPLHGAHRSLSPRPDPQAELRKSLASAPLSAPVVKSTSVKNSASGLKKSFLGLNFFDQRFANNGNQFSVEPPDQALCVGKGFVLESVNDVLQVYNTSGSSLSGVIDLNTFYGYPAAFDRTTGVVGPELTDPICYYDPDNQRWIHVVLTLDVDADGNFTGPNHLDIAVSTTSSPLGAWILYTLPVQDDGTQGTPDHGCSGAPDGTGHGPCIGDYPHIGADKNGVYLTTNEYAFFGPEFRGAQIYAFSKKAFARGDASVQVVQFDTTGAVNGAPGFTVWPAQSPAGKYATKNGGTEYFLSSMAAEETGNTTGYDNRIALWTLTNSKSLDSSSPALALALTVLGSEVYGVPPRSDQKPGNVPLRDCLFVVCRGGIGPSPEVEAPLDSNDSRMQQVWYADGKVWGALDTIVNVGGNIKAGIAFFVVKPSGSIAKQGYLAVARNNVTYPAAAILDSGKGVMAFTLVGADYYPSAAYVKIDDDGVDKIQIAATGKGPQDGFSGYNFFANSGVARPRWGDYGAAVIDGDQIWIASEYIAQTCTFAQFNADTTCGGTRGALGNWATRVSLVKP